MEVMVTPASEQSSRFRLNVPYDGKDGIFTRWEDSPTALSRSTKNQLRVVKNALQILARIIHEHFCCNRGFAATYFVAREA